MRCVIGVDLGGTNVRAGAYYEDGAEAGPKFSNPSRAQSGTEAVFDAVSRTILEAAQAAETPPVAVGMAIPGMVDDLRGVVAWSSNFGETINGVFHYWQHVDVRKPIEDRVGLPVRFGNDANLAALAEYRFGTGRNRAKCLVMLTLGTGIGGGVVFSPDALLGESRGHLLLLGGNVGGAELGHVVVQADGMVSNAGVYGDIEAYCGRDAIVTRAVHRLKRNRESLLDEMVGGDWSKISPKTIAEAAERGDEVALEVFDEVGTMLGVGIGNYINIFAPDVFAIGGQVAKAGDALLKPAIRTARNIAVPALFEFCRITV
ncbi:MAG TPA: ROK family protein, partial [Fimbriimonas sp.]